MTASTSSVRPSISAREGETVGGRWRLGPLLGVGAMAAVYEAQHRNGNRVAIKILRPEMALNDQALGRFLREGYLANAVEHPGAVSVLDDGMTDDGLPFLVMEFLEGESLEGRLERLARPLPIEDVLAIGVALLDTLEAAQLQSIVHRDLKPDNVFLCADGAVKILDFGIARLNEMPLNMKTTQVGIAVGTPSFMAREQVLGQSEQIDGQTDLWALAATLLYSLSRRCVYEAPTINALLIRVATLDPPAARLLAPDLPVPIADVLDRALSHDRSWRWRSATDMKNALLTAAHEAEVFVPEHPSQAGYVRPVHARPALRDILPPFAQGISTPPPAVHETQPPPSERPTSRAPRFLYAPQALRSIYALRLGLGAAVVAMLLVAFSLRARPDNPPVLAAALPAAPTATTSPTPELLDAPAPPAEPLAPSVSPASSPPAPVAPAVVAPAVAAPRVAVRRGSRASEDLGATRH